MLLWFVFSDVEELLASDEVELVLESDSESVLTYLNLFFISLRASSISPYLDSNLAEIFAESKSSKLLLPDNSYPVFFSICSFISKSGKKQPNTNAASANFPAFTKATASANAAFIVDQLFITTIVPTPTAMIRVPITTASAASSVSIYVVLIAATLSSFLPYSPPYE